MKYTAEEFKSIKKENKCECHLCDNKECIHRDAFRRLPKEIGGLGLCPNIKKIRVFQKFQKLAGLKMSPARIKEIYRWRK